MVWVTADDFFDLLSGLLPGGEGAVGVTVGVVQVQDINSGVGPQTRLTQHRGTISEVTCNEEGVNADFFIPAVLQSI